MKRNLKFLIGCFAFMLTTTVMVHAQTANALHFGGTDDHIVISNPTAFDIGTSSDLIIEASIKTGPTGFTTIVSRMDPNGTGTIRGYQLFVTGAGKLHLEWQSSGGVGTFTSNSSVDDGLCHDIKLEVIRSTSTANIYRWCFR